MAENVTATQHNIYTLRGTLVRDPLGWSKYIGEALYPFGLEAEVMFASHHWPRWGNARIQEVLRAQRVVLPPLSRLSPTQQPWCDPASTMVDFDPRFEIK
jgi:alkyl sulfatase BDS1-like metallo-beta-lactamase superfamily hydrolase